MESDYLQVWEWCKRVWYSNSLFSLRTDSKFENDVKEYGIQTNLKAWVSDSMFENDVKEYGIQTLQSEIRQTARFENDVKEYGIQTFSSIMISR